MAERVLITGVAGFIGSNLLDYLLENTGWIIDGVDNFSTGTNKNIRHRLAEPRFTFIQNDLISITSLRPYKFVFHLAALPRIQPSFELVNEHIVANVLRSTHLLELMIAENYFPRFIYSGSSAIYGTPKNIPTAEDEPVNCLSPYAFQKYEVERYLELLSTRYPVDYVTLRYFNPYGPRSFNPVNKFNAYSSVVGIFLDRWKNKKSLQVTGDGSQKRDFIHVNDLAKANYMAAIHGEKLNTAFNIGFGNTMGVLDLAKMISPDYEFIPRREGEAEITFADTKKAADVLGWKPAITLQEYIKNVKAS
ncbi:MAG TPA: NAD-dependent epimerase/dehydratase family protein [Bacteroidia bacterium]|nr:NAD-dependent epimerase/dehydratase family protein [Bacteroidia bacterium]